jgi:hypothetical protein
MAEKRHLNVMVEPTAVEHVPARSSAQWVLLGVVLVVVLWLPLAMLGLWLSRALTLGHSGGGLRQLCGILPIVGSFAAATYLGGLVVVRFGPAASGPVNSLLTGGLAGVLVTSLATAAGALRPWPVGVVAYTTLILVGAVAAAGGGRHGRKMRNAATLTSPTRPVGAGVEEP